MYKVSLRSLKHLKLSTVLHFVPYHWNINIRASTEAAEAMQGEVIKDLILKTLELILKTMARE